MGSAKKSNKSPSALQTRLVELEEKVAAKCVQVRYDRLEAAGLKLEGGLCRMRGEYHLFIDKRKSTAEKIEILDDFLAKPFPKDVPEVTEYA